MSNGNTITATIEAGLTRRYRAERRYRAYGIAALVFAGVMLAVLLVTIIRPGIDGFTRHELELSINTAPIATQLKENPEAIDYHTLLLKALERNIYNIDAPPDLKDKRQRHKFYAMAGTFAAFDIKRQLLAQPEYWGKEIHVWIPLSDNADQYLKGHIRRDLDPTLRPLDDQQIAWIDGWNGFWKLEGELGRWRDDEQPVPIRIRNNINTDFFIRGDSRAPEAAGFMGAIVGSLLTLAVCLMVALPVSIAAAIVLEEFARKTRIAEWLEIIINNLAAVPSIIYGLLGLSIYLQLFSLPRSSALVGGLTLSMLIMPVMIIAARAAIRAVPPSMRQAAAGLGATPLQVVRHHVLPYAMPGIMTGTILSICRALGETAPLLMIGMVAFVADIPRGLTDPATAMPVEIYLWASSPELGFIEKTSSAIMVLLVILLLLNVSAIKLRNKSQLMWN